LAIRGMDVVAETIGIARYGPNFSRAFDIHRPFPGINAKRRI
jgi:hypothetical protein